MAEQQTIDKIPLCIPAIGKEEINAVKNVLKSGWLAHGPKTKEFEENFAKYLGVKHAISTNSCASALQLAIQSLNLKGEIICPSFTMSATANAIITAGCTPVFAEVDWDTCNLDPKKIEEKITKNTVAIMPVHFAGQCCKMDEIMEIAKKHNLKVIEDSAETIGGTYSGQQAGTFGDAGCYSFYPVKNITTGEGGMIVTNDDKLAEKAKALKAHGIPTTAFEREKMEKPWFRASILAGYNMRLCDVNAAIGVEQLKKLDKLNEKRRKNAEYLNKKLKDIKEIDLPVEDKNAKHTYQMYTIKLVGLDRGKFIIFLKEKGISTSVHFDPPVHLQPYMQARYKKGDFPVTEKLAENIVTLPMYPGLKKEQMDRLIETIREHIRIIK